MQHTSENIIYTCNIYAKTYATSKKRTLATCNIKTLAATPEQIKQFGTYCCNVCVKTYATFRSKH
jgi:hypothetical protein